MLSKMLGLKQEPIAPAAWQNMSKKELLQNMMKLQAQNINLHSELTIQHEKANTALRIVRDFYVFMFRVVRQYIEVRDHYAAEGLNKPIPAIWLAARVCEVFDDIFDKHPVALYELGPDKTLLKNMFQVSRLNPGSKVQEYLSREAGNEETQKQDETENAPEAEQGNSEELPTVQD